MKYDLVGVDGNAFAIMAYVIRAMRDEGLSDDEIKAYQKDATSSEYNHLLGVSFKMVDKLNNMSDNTDTDDE